MDRLIFITRSLRSHELEHQSRSTSTMSTETRREIYHTTMEMSEPISTCYRLITEEQKPVMATVEIAYEEGHKDGYQEGWQNCNRELHDVVAQESYDDGIRQGRALAFKSYDPNVVRQKRQRSRSGGSVAPRKKGAVSNPNGAGGCC